MLRLSQKQYNDKGVSYRGSSDSTSQYDSEEKIKYTAPVLTSALIGSSTVFMNPSGPAGQIAQRAHISRFTLSANKIGEKILAVKNTIFQDIANSNIALMLVKSSKTQAQPQELVRKIMANPEETTQILTAANIKEGLITKYKDYMKSVADILSKEEEGVASLGAKIRNPKLIFASATAILAALIAALFVRKANKDIENAEL